MRLAFTNSPGAVGSVGGKTRRNVDGDFFRLGKALVDEANAFERAIFRGARDARAEDGVDDERGEVRVGREISNDLAAAGERAFGDSLWRRRRENPDRRVRAR